MKKMKWMALMVLMMFGGVVAGCTQSDEPLDLQESDEYLVEMAETFIIQLSEGKFEEAMAIFSDEMLAALTPELLEQTWDSVEEQFGIFIGVELASTAESDDMYSVFLTAIFNDDEVIYQVVFNNDEQIVGFFIV